VNEVEIITHELLSKEFSNLPQLQRSKLIEALQEAIVYLLIHDLERLWNILYRIDVNEKKVKDLFNLSNPAEIAPQMALLIYKRLEQKALTRIQYRQ
jgi:c-di-GMP-related signal transduction protein